MPRKGGRECIKRPPCYPRVLPVRVPAGARYLDADVGV